MGSLKKEAGLTLIELLVVIAIISILATIAIMQFWSYKVRTYDTAAKSDLRSAMRALEDYYLENGTYPKKFTDLMANGFNFSKDVCFTKYKLEKGGERVHIHIMHTASSNAWHTKYPDDGYNVAYRKPKKCIKA